MSDLWTLEETSHGDDRWHALLECNEHLVFHEPGWARVIELGLGGAPLVLLLCRGGRVVGGMCGFVKALLWTQQFYCNVPYGGVIGEAPGPSELAALLVAFGRTRGFSRMRLVDQPHSPPLRASGFELATDETHLLRLRGLSKDQLWRQYRKNIRRDVRRAERSGLAVTEVRSPSELHGFYELYLASMRRNNALAKYGFEFVAEFFRFAAANSKGTILLATQGSTPVAGVLLVDSKSMSHYVMGGSLPSALPDCPNDLLLHRSIERALELGMEWFDFLPSGPDDVALRRFKLKWGAMAMPIDTYTRDLLGLRMAAYQWAYRAASSEQGRKLIEAYRRVGRRAKGL